MTHARRFAWLVMALLVGNTIAFVSAMSRGNAGTMTLEIISKHPVERWHLRPLLFDRRNIVFQGISARLHLEHA